MRGKRGNRSCSCIERGVKEPARTDVLGGNTKATRLGRDA